MPSWRLQFIEVLPESDDDAKGSYDESRGYDYPNKLREFYVHSSADTSSAAR